jgi:CubicO group peptidase (beta-lactamase class C family)
MSVAEVTGAGVAIINGGKIVYAKAYGFRDSKERTPLMPDSVMDAASLTKSAFAFLVMQLASEKIIDLDAPVQRYLPKPLPDYAQYSDLRSDGRYAKITAAMLLSHTAGFQNLRWLSPDRKLKIHFEPGTQYAYSGEGFQLLQFVVETVTNRPLKDLMQERVFQPLGMSRSSMVWEDRFNGNFAQGHDEYGRPIGHPRRNEASAAGSMQTTLDDFSRFLAGVLNGMSAKKRQGMLTPRISIPFKHQFPTLEMTPTEDNRAIRLSYGLGWGLYWSPYGKAFFKEGHEDGFRNYTVAFEKTKDAIVIMTNSANGEGIFKDLLESLQSNTFTPIEWEGYTPYDKLPARKPLPVHNETTLSAAQLERLAGRYSPSPDLVLTVAVAGSHLTMRENKEEAGELWPQGPLEFFSKTSDDVIKFELDEQGKIVRLVIHTGGRAIPIPRVQ